MIMGRQARERPSLLTIALAFVLFALFGIGCLDARNSYPSKWVTILPDHTGAELSAQRVTSALQWPMLLFWSHG